MIIGGYPRPVIYAGDVLRVYKRQYGTLLEFMIIGREPNKEQILAHSEIFMDKVRKMIDPAKKN